MSRRPNPNFWRGRRVLLTGHSGFKGAWMVLLLDALGAQVSGLSLPPQGLSLHGLLGLQRRMPREHWVDLRQPDAVAQAVQDSAPELVLHLAAQALVGEGYRDPVATFETNLNGSMNLLQALRGRSTVAATVVVTSDKVYRNNNSGRPFVEGDPLGGHDPYSASKAACELLVACWRQAFAGELAPMATARAGNVIGGGDFGQERLLPDLVRAQTSGQALRLRNPDATRPFQHVLDVCCGYLLLAEALAEAPAQAPAALNFGPADAELRVRDLLQHWQQATGRALDVVLADGPVMPEQRRLALDSRLATEALGWAPQRDTATAIAETARWYGAWAAGQDLQSPSQRAVESALSSPSLPLLSQPGLVP